VKASDAEWDLGLAWSITVNDVVVRVEAATLETYESTDDAWQAANQLRAALVGVLGEPRANEGLSAVAVPVAPLESVEDHSVFRGVVKLRWAPTAIGQLSQPRSESQQ
jgi:hypothetical protein